MVERSFDGLHNDLQFLTCPVTICTTAIPPSDVPRYILLASGLSVAIAVIPRGHGEAIILSGSEVWRFQKRRCCPVDAIRSIDLSSERFDAERARRGLAWFGANKVAGLSA